MKISYLYICISGFKWQKAIYDGKTDFKQKRKYTNFVKMCHQSSQITKSDYPRNQALA